MHFSTAQLRVSKPANSIFDIEDEEDPVVADFDYRHLDHITEAINLPSNPAYDNEEWDYVMEAFRSTLEAESEGEYLDGSDPDIEEYCSEQSDAELSTDNLDGSDPDIGEYWSEQSDSGLSTDVDTGSHAKAEERPSDATSDLLEVNTVSFQDQPLEESSAANPPSGDGMPASMETILSHVPEPSSSAGGHQVPSKIPSSPSMVSTGDVIASGLHHLWI